MEWMASKTVYFFQKIQLFVELLSFSIFSSFISKGLTGDFWPAAESERRTRMRVWNASQKKRKEQNRNAGEACNYRCYCVMCFCIRKMPTIWNYFFHIINHDDDNKMQKMLIIFGWLVRFSQLFWVERKKERKTNNILSFMFKKIHLSSPLSEGKRIFTV